MIKGFTCGAFDLLHPGHLYMLRECKEHCDYLIVGLHTNPHLERKEKNVPIQSTYERFVQLRECIHVDQIIPYDYERDLVNILSTEDINIRFVSEEYKNTNITGWKICDKRNIKIFYNSRLHDFSSSELRKRI